MTYYLGFVFGHGKTVGLFQGLEPEDVKREATIIKRLDRTMKNFMKDAFEDGLEDHNPENYGFAIVALTYEEFDTFEDLMMDRTGFPLPDAGQNDHFALDDDAVSGLVNFDGTPMLWKDITINADALYNPLLGRNKAA